MAAFAKGLFNARTGVLMVAVGTASLERLGSKVFIEELVVAIG